MVDTTWCMPRETNMNKTRLVCKKGITWINAQGIIPMHSTVKEVNQFIDVGNYLVILLKPFYRESILPQWHKDA